jgi:hypothetical protein
MFDSVTQSPFELLHACIDVIVTGVAAGLVLLVFFPLTLCAASVKCLLTVLRLRPVPAQVFPPRLG